MNSEPIVMTFLDPHKADTVLAAIQAMRKSPILCLSSVVVATRERTGEITVRRPCQEPDAAQEDRDTQLLLALAELILRAPAPDAIDALIDRGMDGRFVSEIVKNMEGESSALFVLARENSVSDAGETHSTLALFRGRIHQTSLPSGLETYLSGREPSTPALRGKETLNQRRSRRDND
jgi:uncharacterized membrane protein